MTQNKGELYFLIRSKDNIPARYRLLNNLRFYFGDKFVSKMEERIKVIVGDITESYIFGASKEEINKVIKNVNVIINSGAIVKHYGKAQNFEDINVKGAKNVIKFCQKYGKRLLHISTASVSGIDKKEETIEKNLFSEDDLYVGQDFKNIYITTKFEAEIAVLEAIYDGLDAQILRIGNMTNRYSDGTFQHNVKDNAFAKRLKSFIQIGAFPKYLLEHEIEFTPVDLAASAIIKILNNKSDCNVFHIVSSYLVAVTDIVQVANEMGIELVPVSDVLMSDIINGMIGNDNRKQGVSGIIEDLNRDRKLIYTSATKLDIDFTENYLKKCGFKWKKLGREYITKYLQYFRKIGFIEFGK